MVKGEKKNFLTMVSEQSKGKHPRALFQCDCGNIKSIRVDNVVRETTKSCGCKKSEMNLKAQHNYKHGESKSRIYQIYYKMKSRCYNPNYSESEYYGKRGIKICKEWLDSFEKFYEWSITNGYADNLSIDRINVNKGYYPNNCKWSTPKEQSRNRRNNIYITYNNETRCLSEWCEIFDLKYQTILQRINRGWDKVQAIITPPHNYGRR